MDGEPNLNEQPVVSGGNPDDHTPLQNPKPKRRPRTNALAADQVEKRSTGFFRVRIVSYRNRFIDDDNFFGKYVVDSLRYCGAIPNDSPRDVRITTEQVQVPQGSEKTVITISRET